MIEVLYFSDREVKQKLLDRVRPSQRLLLVCGARHGPAMGPVERRQPFAALEASLGQVLDQLVVADEGTVEGMWRDPLGDLADLLYPGDRRGAYAAASGYLLLQGGVVKAVLKKQAAPGEDAWFVQQAVSRLESSVPPPDPGKKPRRRTGAGPPLPRADQSQDQRSSPADPKPLAGDPWALLGIARGTPLAQARKAFRSLIAQYHPDKVAHLAPEFRALAEQRTRELLAAWDQLEAEGRP